MSPQSAGFAAAAYGVGLLLGNLSGGWFGDRFGLRTAAVASQLTWAVACLAMPLVPVGALAVLAAIAGLCGGATRPNLSALVATALPADRRREGIALSRSASNAGFTIGPPLGGLLAAYDFSLVFVVDAVSSVILAAVIWRYVPSVDPCGGRACIGSLASAPPGQVDPGPARVDRGDRHRLPPALRDPPAAAARRRLTCSRVRGTARPELGRHRAPGSAAGHSPPQPPSSRVIAAGSHLVASGLAVLGIWPALFGAAIAVAVITAGEMLYKPTATAQVVDAAPEGMTGRFSSLYAAASISGMSLAPALGGITYQHHPDLLYPPAAALALAAAATTYPSRRRAPALAVS